MSGRKASAPVKAFIDPAADSAFAQGVLCDQRTELIDDIITSGVLGIHPLLAAPGTAPLTDDKLHAEIVVLANELIAHHSSDTGDSLKFETTAVPFGPKSVTDSARIISREVNDFTDKNGSETKRIAKALRAILKPLAASKDNTKVVSARAVYNDEDSGGDRHVTVTLFLNTDIGQAVVLYMVEGRM